MSNRRHRASKRTSNPPSRDLSSLGAALARAHGCTCRPDVTTTRDKYGIVHVTVAHDACCPLIAHKVARWN